MAILLAFGVLGGLEHLWRARGFSPSLTDDNDLWCLWRDRANAAGTNALVLLGASRMQLDFDLESLQTAFPHHQPIMLALEGRLGFLATLEDLAADRKFSGSVICDVMEAGLMPDGWNDQRGNVNYRHDHWTTLKKGERLLRSFFQSNWVVGNPAVDLGTVARCAVHRQLPKPPYLVTKPSRFRLADYASGDIHSLRIHRLDQTSKALAKIRDTPKRRAAFARGVERVGAGFAQLRRKGGKAVLVHTPTSGEVGTMEANVFPKAAYWDPMVKTLGVPAVHFQEQEAMRALQCPEGSHLDRRDAPAFTRALVAEILRQKAL